MPAIVIVALPKADEPVNEISSEKKAHMTLLYLDAPMGVDTEHIVQFVEHACNVALSQFGLSVEKRGTLGPDNADVLFFDTDFAGDLRRFRAELLKDDTIQEHYVKTDQFPGWIPHLTMGYPNKPAKKMDPDDRYRLSWINFDRIAVWLSDFDGPEFELSRHGYGSLEEAAWSEEYGVHIMHHESRGSVLGARPEGGSLSHADPTVGDVYDGMTEDQKTLVDVVTAATDDDKFTDEELDALYDVFDSMDDNQRLVLNFIAGESQSGLVDEEVEHHGVKGMHWGVRKDDSGGTQSHSSHLSSTKPKIGQEFRSGGQLHKVVSTRQMPSGKHLVTSKKVLSPGSKLDTPTLAGVKSRGRRVVQAILGDKTFYKRALGILGVAAVGVAASFVAPSLLPVSLLAGLGGAKAVSIAGLGTHVIATKSSIALGSKIVTDVGLAITGTGMAAANAANSINNVYRAVTANSKARREFTNLAIAMEQRQRMAAQRTHDLLTRNGTIDRTKLQQDVMSDEEFLAHFGVRGMRWGVRRAVGSNGRVVGSVSDAIGKSQTGKDLSESGVRKGKQSADHKRIQRAMKKDISSLSTEEIKAITARIKAVRELKTITQAQKEAQRSLVSKVARWAVGQVVTGAKQAGESYIREATGDQLKRYLPKTDTQKKKDAQEAAKQQKESKKQQKAQEEHNEAVRKLLIAVQGSDGTFKVTDKG